MYFLNELKDLKIYKKQFMFPINDKNKRKNSLVMLMTPSFESSIKTLNHPLLIPRYFTSYYMERSAMYYINGSASVLNESSIETIIQNDTDKDTKRIIYSGYDNDIEKASKVINPTYMNRLLEKYDIKNISFPLYIEIYRRKDIPEDNSILNISSYSSYNSVLKNYDAYLKFCVMEFLLKNIKKDIPVQYIYALALYESGLYQIHKSNWIFGDELKILCNSIDVFMKTGKHNKLLKIILSNPQKLNTITVKNMSRIDFFNFKKLFTKIYENSDIIEESVVEQNVYQDDMLHIGENCFLLLEDTKDNTVIKRLIYNDRIKNIKDMKEIYEKVKKEVTSIRYTFNSLDKYNSLNLIVDLHHYNNSFIRNNTFIRARGYNVYMELMKRLINDTRMDEAGYKLKTVVIPITDWDFIDKNRKMWMIQESINPISCIYHTMMMNPAKLKTLFPNTILLFTGEKGYFKLKLDDFDPKKQNQFFIRGIKALRDKSFIPSDDEEQDSSPAAVTATIVDKIEKTQGITIDDISKATTVSIDKVIETKPKAIPSDDKKSEKVKNTEDNKKSEIIKEPESTKDKKSKSDTDKEQKDELVEKIAKSALVNQTEDEVLDDLDTDDKLKQILADLSEDPDNKSNITAARASRMVKLQNDLMDKEFKGKPLKTILNAEIDPMEEPLPIKELNIDSVNDEWKELTYPSSFDVYDPDTDIVKIFNSFSEMSHPLIIKDIKVEDISTSEDVVDLYTVQYEDENGKRFTIKAEIPKFIDNKYMKLRGNRKDISSQLFLMPIIKTDEDTVQIVSNYKKIFIRRFGTTSGKSINSCDRLIKTLNKNTFKGLKVIEGDNSRICSRYELPIDYIDLASIYNKIITKECIYYFNQDELRSKYENLIDDTKGIPFAYNIKNKNIEYFSASMNDANGDFISFSYYLALMLSTQTENEDNLFGLYNSAPLSVRYTYSKASIMSSEIPLIVVCAYSEGLVNIMKRAGIEFELKDNKKLLNKDIEDYIKFNDGYLIYKLDYASSLLMNGLKHCNTDSYSLSEINSKGMYLDFLDQFGGRIKADGLDNFYNLMIDKPITYDSLKYYKLPTNYIDVLLYANRLLVDNKHTKHTSITDNRRIRRNEQIPAILYGVLSTEYGNYCNRLKHGRNMPMSIKPSAVIDAVLLNSTTADKSIINALTEYEAYSTVTPKGPTGMNSDRSYTLDKRSFDDSMFNVLSLSTGFAGNVGVSRQATIDSNISTARGYITNKNTDMKKLSPTKSFCMSEALTPFGTTRDDPFRSAMTFIQTSKHSMRSKRTNPGLITSGADEALPYLVSNIFAKKADKNGTVIDISENRMIVKYDDETYDYINLEENVEKNSSSGFFVVLKLDTDLKVGKKFKKGEIIAYDKSSFSNDIGPSDNIAYNIGTIAKIAILNTDEGFEDSAIISEDLCEAMSSEVVLMCPNHPLVIPKDTNVYNLVKKGQKIEEGDTLLTIQRPYDEEDANTLLKNLVDDPEEITNLGRIPIKSKVTGTVQDIVIYRTVDVEDLSPSLKKIVKDYEKGLNAKKKEMSEYGVENADFIVGSTDKLPPTGKLKNASEGIVIEIYLKYEDKMKIGDKLVYYSALKGVVKDIFPVGKEPTSEFRPNEKIHSLLSIGSVNGRMVGSVLINGAIYKYLIELSRKCKDILGIKYKDNLFE